MIEIRRGLYMDEKNGEKLECFPKIKALMKGIVNRILS